MDEKPIRKPMRLKKYDYSADGAYFITICIHNRQSLLGSFSEAGELTANDAGKMVKKWFCELERKFDRVKCDEFICMPDHVHLIIFLQSDLTRDGATHRSPPAGTANKCFPSIPDIVQWFKTMTTNRYIDGVTKSGWQPFKGKFWQRGFFDRIVRNDEELQLTRTYIINNPLKTNKP